MTDEVAMLRAALRGCLSAMEMQENRESGAFHIPQPSAWRIWSEAKHEARFRLGDVPEPFDPATLKDGAA